MFFLGLVRIPFHKNRLERLCY